MINIPFVPPAHWAKLFFILVFWAAPFFFAGCLPEPGFLEPDFPDIKDQCPNQPGLQDNNGCPADNNGNGLNDWWENNYGVPTDPDADDDADGLTNSQEGSMEMGKYTNPFSADDDGDGVTDIDDLCPRQQGSADNNGCPA